jgi:ATP-dependent DNA helicase DinG
MPILMWPQPVILVAPTPLLEHLQAVEIPRLQEWLQTERPIETYSDNATGRGLMLADPESWLAARLAAGFATSEQYSDNYRRCG